MRSTKTRTSSPPISDGTEDRPRLTPEDYDEIDGFTSEHRVMIDAELFKCRECGDACHVDYDPCETGVCPDCKP